MKHRYLYLLTFALCLAAASCHKQKNTEPENNFKPASPRYTAVYDRSTPISQIDIEQAMDAEPVSLKLSDIASEIEYYTVGDANFPVTQAISIPDREAFLTFNNPRIFYRRQGVPSKRYGFKAIAYRWNNEMNGQNLFYDKKTTRLYCAMSGKDQKNKEKGDPYIGELPHLDSLLTITSYIFPEMVDKKYPLHLQNDKLLGFSSSGYTLCHYPKEGAVPDGITTFTMQGDTLCRFNLQESPELFYSPLKHVPYFHTFHWNTEQDKMTFMIPYCDTVYQLQSPDTLKPLHALNFGKYGVSPEKRQVESKKAWLRSLTENSKGVFMGVFQKDGRKMLNWLGWEDEFKPVLTHQIVYLKSTGRTYCLPYRPRGFQNDLDGGLDFWPDGQTDDYLYMIRTVTEMRENVKRTGAPNQKKLIELLDNPKVRESEYVMVVVR